MFPGKVPGARWRWPVSAVGGQQPPVSVGSFQVAYKDANWDWKTFDIDAI